jgi:hypothetical protein
VSASVGEDFPNQQARVRIIQQHAREIGPAGAFLVAITERSLREAEEAAISGDPVRIIRAYEDLRSYEE